MSDAITDALARARAAAESAPPPAVINHNQNTAVATGPVARPRSLTDALASAGTSVDSWLGVKDDDFLIDKQKIQNEELLVTIRLSEVKFGFGVRFSNGGVTTYLKSYTGVSEAKSGRNWAECVSQAQALDQKCRGSYDLADIPMTLLQKIDSNVKGNKVVVEEGTRIGHTTGIMNFAVFMKWVSEAVQTYGEEAEIPVKLTVGKRNYPGGTYGVIEFATATN